MSEILLAEPRGFCAGVDRAIDIVEHALAKFGRPIYVRHEIVHNTYVVNDLKTKGAIFIEELSDVPPGATLVFSTLNKNWKAYLLAIVAAEKLLKLVPDGTHDFNKFIRPSQLMRWIEAAGLEVVDATGLHYNPLQQSFRTGPGVDVNYFVVARKAV